MYYYQLYSLTVASDIPIRGVAESDAGRAAYDLRIRLCKAPDSLASQPFVSDLCASMTEKEFLFYNEKLNVRIYLRDGREIRVDPDYYRDPDAVSVYLLGNVLGAVLYMRGWVPLRASAIMTERGAVLFAGAAGAGKSTLACALVRRGYPLIADAIAPIALQDGEVTVLSGALKLNLWRDSLQLNNLSPRAPARIRKPLNKYYVSAPETAPAGALAVYKIYHLTVHNRDRLLIHEIPEAAERLKALSGNLYHQPYAKGLNREESALKAVMRLAERPVSSIVRPQRPKDFEAFIKCVEGDLEP